MQIVNYIKDSTIECSPFSWGLTLFSFGCNFHCKMCDGYNYEKVTNKDNIIGNAKEIIEQNITPMHDCVIFLGGEPTIWGDKLIEALKFCHEKGLKTKIFSNGYNYKIIEKINESNFWDDQNSALEIVNEKNELDEIVNSYFFIFSKIKDLIETYEMIKESYDEELHLLICEELIQIEVK